MMNSIDDVAIDRRQFRSQTSDNMDRCNNSGESSQRRESQKRKESEEKRVRRERVSRKEIKVRER